MLETIIASGVRAKIISFFFLNEGKKYYIREVARLLGINTNQAWAELHKLAELGMLKKEQAGNTRIFCINPYFIFHDELVGIVRKSSGFEKTIGKELSKIKRIDIAFIFGSCAEGTFNARSDVDLMVIGEPDQGELNKAICRAERKINHSVQYIVYPLHEFKKRQSYGFLKNVLRRKRIPVIGDINELERT